MNENDLVVFFIWVNFQVILGRSPSLSTVHTLSKLNHELFTGKQNHKQKVIQGPVDKSHRNSY